MAKEHKTGTYRFLSHSGIGLLRKIINWTNNSEAAKTDKEVINVPFKELRWESTPFFAEAVVDLSNYSLILYQDGNMIQLRAELAYKIFVYQSMLRAFDNLNVAME